MNIPDVQVSTDAESLSHASVQLMVQEEKVSTSTAVRMLFVCFIALLKLHGQCLVAMLACNSIA